jgi:glycosyltransferase involved in cell wall biosynthesis
MRIMVFDVPAESGGALSVLHEFYNEFKLDKENEYIFVLSLPELKETSNIKVLRFPWIKKSWGHRLYFDHFIAPKLIKRHNVDKALSLQNIIIPHTKVHQSVFLHNAIPFSDHRFSFSENRFLWVYQNFIGRNILKSIRKADNVIVQTKWMADKIVDELNIHHDRIEVKPPRIDITFMDIFKETKESLSTFFYPASAAVFKNHKVIIEACLKLKEEGIYDYKVIFTLKGNENENTKDLFNIVNKNKLPVEYVGTLERSKVFELYTKSILIFPSYLETVGLPLLEARIHETPIIASDCAFSHEILDRYEKVNFFDPNNEKALADIILKYIM